MRNSIAFAFLFCVGCTQGGGGANMKQEPWPNPAPATAFTGGIFLSDDPGRFAAGKPIDAFNFARLDDLWVRVTVPAMQGSSTLHIDFTNPLGEMLYEDHVVFTTDPAKKTTMMPIGESQVLQGTAVPGGYALDRRIPIFGTVFTRYPPTGDWVVSASVDGFMTKLSVPMHVSMVR